MIAQTKRVDFELAVNAVGRQHQFSRCAAELVTAIITERGVAYPPYTQSLRALKLGR